MNLQVIMDLNIDFYDKKYILINAKQYDKNSRFISVTCYNRGQIMPINSGEHAAYIRYRKADENGVFNECSIDRKGKILVELTEQMLASDGICCADFILVNKGDAKIDVDTGDVLYIDNASILSSMVFYIDVSEVAVDNLQIESSYEYDGLNNAIEKVEAKYREVIQLSKSYAIGNADGIRENEDNDNAKYYYQQSLNNASISSQSEANASASAQAASASESAASASSESAKSHADRAYGYMNTSLSSSDKAKEYKNNAEEYMNNAKEYKDNAEEYMNNAKEYKDNAEGYMNNASASEQAASFSEVNALNSADRAQSYTVGGTGTRENEDSDNAKYYYEAVKNIIIGVDSGFIPMGTLTFAELLTAEKLTGYVYNINEDFVTDSSFREGEGKSYTAGTNVYCTAEGYWDCLGGASFPTATVDEVRIELGI